MVELIKNNLSDFHAIDITRRSRHRTGISLDTDLIDFQKVFLMSSDENYILADYRTATWKLFWGMVDNIRMNHEKLWPIQIL
jgi:hypothetical protein